jgi:addiction module HigA family antidote
MTRISLTPGEALAALIDKKKITRYRVSKDIGITASHVQALIDGRAVTAKTAHRLGRYFGNGAEFWMDLQTRSDLRGALEDSDFAEAIKKIQPL